MWRGSRTVRYSLWERERERSRVSSIGARILLPTAAPVRYTGGMFRGLLALLLVASAGAAAARRLAFAVLPLRPLAECAPAIARRFTRLLEQRLRARGARVVRDRRAADRVLSGTLRLQAMVRARGDVWELEVEQVEARTGR